VRLLTAVFVALAVACAVSPLDLELYRTADPGIRLLVSYGVRCVPGTIGKGCAVPRNAPRYAVVVSRPR
jgi:hypothetical protein